MNNLLVKNGKVLEDGKLVEKDILIVEGKIEKVEANIEADVDVLDAKGNVVLPGFMDMHCHLRDPGLEYKEDIATGSRSAAKGGFTAIACMPNTKPVIDNFAIADYVVKKAEKEAAVRVYPIGCISKGMEGKEIAEIGDLKEAGCVAVSDDGKPVSSAALMKKAMMYARDFQMPVISHCEDLSLVDDGVMNEGYNSTIMGLRGIPRAAEEIMVAREILLSEYTGIPVHLAHVSTKTGVALIRDAKKRGVKVTAETCPHYFSLTDDACLGFNTLAKVNPPLREQEDVEAIIEGLADGTLDVIATDHAPHHVDEKNCEFNIANFGLVGFETAFSLAITYLVKPGLIALEKLVEVMSANPNKILGLNGGRLEAGYNGDLVVVDLEKKYTVDASKFASKSKNTPYDGMDLVGKVISTVVDGKIIVKEENLEV